MMNWLMHMFAVATLLSLLVLLARQGPAVVAAWRAAGRVTRSSLIVLWLLLASSLLLRAHEDVFTGLDNMTYRNLAQAFLAGRGFHDSDTILEQVPSELREYFLYHPGPVGRPTRDRVFQLSGWQATATQPFFMPTLPLAAAGVEPWVKADQFVPLVGSIWTALLLTVGFGAGGGWGLLAAGALWLMTAWPAWFLRGFYAEGVGAVLISSVMLSLGRQPRSLGLLVMLGFMLGLALCFHPTLAVLAAPVLLVLLSEERAWKKMAGTLAGALLGAFPLWAMTRWVCQPNGDWTRWAGLQRMLRIAEIQAMAWALGLVAVGALMLVLLSRMPRVGAWARRMDHRLIPWGWWAICLLPAGVIWIIPGPIGDVLRTGAAATWSGIRWSGTLIILLCAAFLIRPSRPWRERVWLVLLCWVALMFLFIKGEETPVGLWSQRRFLPVVLVGIGLCIVPLAEGLKAMAARGQWRAKVLAAILAVAGLWNLMQWPAPYYVVNEQGATAWTEDIAQSMGTNRWVIFDYFPHSVPYAAQLRQRVLGIGERAVSRWDDVAEWVASLAQTSEVWLVSSWSLCSLEEGVHIEPLNVSTAAFPSVRAKAFFPAEVGIRALQHDFGRVMPLQSNDLPVQVKALDGSPVGLRGPWHALRHGGAWTRQGSGVIGPIPPAGGTVVFEVAAEWPAPTVDWPEQVLLVSPPWGGEPLRLTVTTGAVQTVRGVLTRPATDAERPLTGVYTCHTERPYNPQEYGLRGYPPELGVVLRQVIIRIE